MFAARVQTTRSLLAYPSCSAVSVTTLMLTLHSIYHYISHPVVTLTTTRCLSPRQSSPNILSCGEPLGGFHRHSYLWPIWRLDLLVCTSATWHTFGVNLGGFPPEIPIFYMTHLEVVNCPKSLLTRQTTDARHQLFHHRPTASILTSRKRKSFMRTVTPLDSSASSSRLRLWKDSQTDVPASVKMRMHVAESLPAGSGEGWFCWRALNRLRTGVGRAKTVMRRCGYLDDAQSVDCDWGDLYGWRRPGHSDRAGKGMRPQVGENCVKDTTEEEDTGLHYQRF